jgi:hypothetical protein
LVEGDGVLLAYVKRVASFDQTGDLKVDAGDLALVQSKIGTPDPTADFDGDGEVTAADLAIAEGHVGHTPSDAVGVPMPGIGTLALSRPIPNPFSGETHFILTLDRPAHVDVKVRDLAGRRVATIFRGALDAGSREFTWAGVSDEGAPVSSGAYFLQVRAGDQRLVGSEIVVKTQ